MGKKVDTTALQGTIKNDPETGENKSQKILTSTFKISEQLMFEVDIIKAHSKEKKMELIARYIQDGVERDKKKYGIQ